MPTPDQLAARHGVSPAAVQVLQDALRRGGGRMAQFSHPELGGMGQWSAGGMTQVGDMFNAALRDRVAALCAELAATPSSDIPMPGTPMPGTPLPGTPLPGASLPQTPAKDAPHREWWPAGLGQPSATGSQDGMRYACFPDARRVVVEQGGAVSVHDSGDHRITGVSQSQAATKDLVFLSQIGRVRASDLPAVG